MGILNDASAWLAEQLQTAATDAATTVIYRRGAESIDLTGKAWVGKTVFSRNPKDGGAAVVHGDRDYLIPAADLVTEGGQTWEPQKGDRIEETTAGVTLRFDVLPQLGEPHARYSDHERTIWRVHTTEAKRA